MKPDIRNIDAVVKRYLPSAPEERIDSGTTRVLHELRTKPRRVSERTAEARVAVRTFTWPRQPEPIHAWRTPWRIAVICAAVAAAFVVAVSPAIWKTPVGGSSTTKTLVDGSRIEMRAGAEAVVENVPDGLMIRLNSGSMMVFAAKQAAGRHLYVQTRDLKMEVVGTVFLVNADDKGSRVAVMEGEVRVQQGTVEKSLRPGEQMASNPKSPAPGADLQFLRETGWSPEAYAYLSKLHESMAQSLAARRSQGRTPSVSDKPKFEEASIRLCEQEVPNAGGRSGGGSGSIRISPGRLDALCLTVNTLISLARPSLSNNPRLVGRDLAMNVTYNFTPEDQTRVRSGPDWVRSEKYAIAAVGDSTDAPTLQGPMLMDLLERRFNLKLRAETEEIPVYALSIAKGGLKIKPIEIESGKYEELRKIRASLPPQRGPMPFGMVLLGRDPTYAGLLGCTYSPLTDDPRSRGGASEYDRFREKLRRDGQPPVCGFGSYENGPNRVISSGASPISLLVDSLEGDSGFRKTGLDFLSDTLNGLLIVDKTGLPDTNCLVAMPSAGTPCAPLFNYFLEYAIDERFFTRRGVTPDFSLPKGPNIFAALEKLGLHLEKSKAPREFIVIEHIDRPTEN